MSELYKIYNIEDLPNEVWLNIPSYEVFQVSNMGRIKSLKRIVNSGFNSKREKAEIIRKQYLNKKGYLYIHLRNSNSKQNLQVHRIVAKAFIPNPENKPQVNHVKGIKTDNRVSELAWNTSSENELHSYRVLGKDNPKSALGKFGELHHRSKKIKCDTLDIVFGSMNEAARELGLSQCNLWGYINGTKKNTTGLSFTYY